MGEFVINLIKEKKYYNMILPVIPVPVMRNYKKKVSFLFDTPITPNPRPLNIDKFNHSDSYYRCRYPETS